MIELCSHVWKSGLCLGTPLHQLDAILPSFSDSAYTFPLMSHPLACQLLTAMELMYTPLSEPPSLATGSASHLLGPRWGGYAAAVGSFDTVEGFSNHIQKHRLIQASLLGIKTDIGIRQTGLADRVWQV